MAPGFVLFLVAAAFSEEACMGPIGTEFAKCRHAHFLGIAGAGMSALAEVLLARGLHVSGTDPQSNEASERLLGLGAKIYTTHRPENLFSARPDLVVVSNAIAPDNPELVEAERLHIPICSRADLLGLIMAQSEGPTFAVAGTHGKTSTTAMLAEVLVRAGLDPTVLIGGEYAPFGGNTHIGSGGAFVTEACEAYASFLSLRPDITLITNVEPDHLDYYGTEARVQEAFCQLVRQTAQEGALVYCSDDAGAALVAERTAGEGPARRIAVGLSAQPRDGLWAAPDGEGAWQVWWLQDGSRQSIGRLSLPVPGEHMVRNALLSLAAAQAAGVDIEQVLPEALAGFPGVGRRFERLGEAGGVLVIDDYAHHPTEIRATLAAARAQYPHRRLLAAFQPHLYSRTRDFLDQFASALCGADAVLLTDIYPAREAPIPGVRVSSIVKQIAENDPDKTVLYLPSLKDLAAGIAWVSRPGDVVLILGAGDVRRAGEAFLAGAAGFERK